VIEAMAEAFDERLCEVTQAVPEFTDPRSVERFSRNTALSLIANDGRVDARPSALRAHRGSPSVLSELTGQDGVGHVVRVGNTVGSDLVLINADITAAVVDSLLPRLGAVGVSGDEIAVVHGESSRPFGIPRPGDLPAWSGGALAWTELAMASRQYARAVPQYLTFMVCARVIATFGILTSNTILIVGAMARRAGAFCQQSTSPPSWWPSSPV
jgi:hypothetical protein